MKALRLAAAAIFYLSIGGNLGAQSIEYVESIYRAGVNDIVIVGDYAYCGMEEGLEVFDISDPASPVSVDHIRLGSVPNVNIVGNYAFLASSNTGLNIVNISDPHNLELVGNNPEFAHAFDVAVQGDYAFVSGYDSSLFSVDVSDLSDPVIVAVSRAPGFGRSIFIVGNYIYTANEGSEFNIFDISNPLNLQRVGGFSNSRSVYDVEVLNGIAYLAYGLAGLLIVDVTDPENPALIGSCDTPQLALGVTLSGQYAYISDGQSGIQIINIENLSQPYIVGSYDTPHYSMNSSLRGDTLWVADSRSIQILDVSDPYNPYHIGDYDTEGIIYKTVVENNCAYIVEPGGLHIIDISNPYLPQRLGYYKKELPGTVWDIYIDGNYAYTILTVSGMTILDISNPRNPVAISNFIDSSLITYGVAVSGQYAYLGGFDLFAVDISDPYNPFQVGSFLPDRYVTKMAVYRDMLFTLEAFVNVTNLGIFDISEPPNIQELANYTEVDAYFSGFDFRGDYVYISVCGAEPDRGWTEVIDISTPSAPRLAGGMALTDQAHDIALAGDYAVVAGWSSGVMLLDISNPTYPFYITGYDTYSYANDVFVLGNLIYLSDTIAELIFRLDLAGLQEDEYSPPSSIFLAPNYPNPFNSSTTIEYGLPKAGRVRIDIYDLQGRKVKTLIDKEMQAGQHKVVWDASGYSSGLYFYRIEAGDYMDTRRMVYLK